jgi:hypothetical protein
MAMIHAPRRPVVSISADVPNHGDAIMGTQTWALVNDAPWNPAAATPTTVNDWPTWRAMLPHYLDQLV